MTLSSFWTLDTSGNWSSGGNWSTQVDIGNGTIVNENIPPPNGYDVGIVPGGSAPLTVTYDTNADVNSLTGQFGATFDMLGGGLTIDNGGIWNQDFLLNAGTLDVKTGWTIGSGFNEAAGATAEVDAGNLAVSTGTIAGTVDGAGNLYLIGGDNFTIAATAVIDSGTLELGVNGDGFGSNTTLTSNFAYAGDFLLDNYSGNDATLDLNGHTATLSGQSALNADVNGPGTLVISGNATIAEGGYSFFSTTNGAKVQVSGTATQYQGAAIDSGLTVTSTGTWGIATDAGISNNGAGTIVNQGLFEKTGGTAISYLGVPISNTGTIAVDTATLQVNGNLTSSGARGLLTGAGTLVDTGVFANYASIDIASLQLYGGGTIAGTHTVDVSGLLSLNNNAVYTLGAHLPFNVGTFAVQNGAQLDLRSAETIGGSFDLSFGTVNLANFALTLGGPTSLVNGLAGGTNGTLTVTDVTSESGFTVYGSTSYVDAGVILQTGNTQLGNGATDTVTLTVNAGSVYDITGAYWLGNPNINTTGTATINNSGLFEMTGAGTATVWHSIFSNTGTLVANGTLALEGQTATLGGTLSGSGELLLGTDWTLTAASSHVTVGTFDNAGIGTLTQLLNYGGNYINDVGATLDLNGHAMTLSGTATLDSGEIGGGGTLTLKNATINQGFAIYGTTTLVDNHLITQTSGAQLGASSTDAVTLDIHSGATYDIATDNWLGNPNIDDTGTATIINAGRFEMTATGTSTVWHANLTNTGTILTDGTLQFSGGTDQLGGVLSGPGALLLATSWTLATPSADVTVGTFDNQGAGTLTQGFTYAGSYINDYGAALALNGQSMSLTGVATLNSGLIGGAGTLTVSNATELNGFAMYGTSTLVDAGLITQTGYAQLGNSGTDAVTLVVNAGATYDIATNNSLGNSNINDTGTATIGNAGLFEMTATGVSDVWHANFTSTGTVLTDGVLGLEGGNATLGGTLSGPGDLVLADNWTLNAASVTVGTLENAGTGKLAAALTDPGAFLNDAGATLDLNHRLATIGAGSVLGGTIDGAGTIKTASGTSTVNGLVLGGAGILSNSGTIVEAGQVTLGNAGGAGTITDLAHSVYDITGDTGIGNSGNGSSIGNAGLFEKTGGTNTSLITAAFSSSGTIEVTSGTLEFTGGFSSTGTIIGTVSTSGGVTTITAPAAAPVTPAALGAPGSPGFLAAPSASDFALSPPGFSAAATQAAAAPPDIGNAGTVDIAHWMPQSPGGGIADLLSLTSHDGGAIPLGSGS